MYKKTMTATKPPEPTKEKTMKINRKHIESIKLHEYPHDVQEMLKDRAIKECKPIAQIVKEFNIQTARLINQSKSAA